SVAMIQRVGINYELSVGIEQHQIGIATRCNCALALETRKFCGRRGHPLNYPLNSKSAPPSFRPNQGQSELQRRDPAPGRKEIPRILSLHLRRTRRVVGRDQVDHSLAQRVPQCLAIRTITDGRRALELRSAVWDLLGVKGKVMRTRLHRDWQPFSP